MGSLPDKGVERVLESAVRSPVSLVLCQIAQAVVKVMQGRMESVSGYGYSPQIFYWDQDRFLA